jgi:CubicO group peptidase (beta-lactamase class C family)
LRKDWNDTMMKRIVDSKLGPHGKYVYSDNDFILLGNVVEAISGMPLDQYVQTTFYRPMGLASTGFKPWQRFTPDGIVPTEQENYFRRQLLRGYVHDEGAAMFGGVSGHAGLFSNAYDLSMLYQMLLNGGTFNGERYLKPETIRLFTAYGSENSRRGLGFDKPEKDNNSRKELLLWLQRKPLVIPGLPAPVCGLIRRRTLCTSFFPTGCTTQEPIICWAN